MTSETFGEILTLSDAAAVDANGFRELPQKTTLTLYLSRGGVGLTIASVEAIALKGALVQARTTKGDLYCAHVDDVFAANLEGKAQARTARRAGFSS